MNENAMFTAVNGVALVGWLLLILSLSLKDLTKTVVPLIALLLSVCYAWIFLPQFFFPTVTGGSFSTLDGVEKLFSQRSVLLAGWIHYLAFDLLIGRYEVSIARQEKIPSAFVIVALIFTFLFGPFGFLVFNLGRASRWIVNRLGLKSGWLIHAGAAFVLLSFILFSLSFTDERTLLGLNVWIKPLKFALSFAIFCPTFALIVNHAPFRQAKIQFYDRAIVAMAFIEIAVITLQAARGETSHYNIHGFINTSLWVVMGVTILLLTIAITRIGWAFLQPTQPPSAMRTAVIGACAMFILAAVSGFLMAVLSKHTIGAPDGGAGLTFVNWSTAHGDLRISHFFALHAAQVLPVVAFASTRLRDRNPARVTQLTAYAYGIVTTTLMLWALLGKGF